MNWIKAFPQGIDGETDFNVRLIIAEQVAKMMSGCTEQIHPDMFKANLEAAYEFVTQNKKVLPQGK